MRVMLRPTARIDAREIAKFYKDGAGRAVAMAFQNRLTDVLKLIADNPEAGSTRFGAVSGFSTLRMWPMRDFPYLVFYIVDTNTIAVTRILHSARDIPPTLRE